jgi:hypothetical protein
MGNREKLRPAFAVTGFVLGSSAAGFAISSGAISLMAILRGVIMFGSQGLTFSLDLSSEIALILCVGILVLGFLLVRGSLMIWRMAVLGGALNLAVGMVLTIFSYAMISVAPEILQPVYNLFLAENVLMGIMAIASGLCGIAALFEQLQRRFTSSSVEKKGIIRLSITLPDGNLIQLKAPISDTLGKLKERIVQSQGKTVEGTAVISRGKKLDDESKTLEQLGIMDGDRITLV